MPRALRGDEWRPRMDLHHQPPDSKSGAPLIELQGYRRTCLPVPSHRSKLRRQTEKRIVRLDQRRGGTPLCPLWGSDRLAVKPKHEVSHQIGLRNATERLLVAPDAEFRIQR